MQQRCTGENLPLVGRSVKFRQALKGLASAGFHRVAWDLRHAAPGSGRGRSGPMAVPGEYSVSLAIYENGVLTAIGSSQTFEVKPLGLATMPAEDPVASRTFYQRAGHLQRVMLGTNTFIQDQLSNLDAARSALLNSGADAELLQQARTIELQLKDMELLLQGDQTRSSRAEFVQPGLLSRLQRTMRGQFSSSGPTQTHRENLEIARQEFAPLYEALKTLADNELERFFESLEKLQLPGRSGGELPVWDGK